MELGSIMKKGDYFNWRYKLEYLPEHMAYHCCSQICVFDGNKLTDTFWIGSSNNVIDESKCELTFLGNINDYDKLKQWDIKYYDPKDIMDLRHSNSFEKDVLLKKGAKKNFYLIKSRINSKIEEHKHDIDYRKRQIENLNKELVKINNGETDIYF